MYKKKRWICVAWLLVMMLLLCAGRKVAYYEMLDILKTELDIRDQDLKEFGLDIDLENKIA